MSEKELAAADDQILELLGADSTSAGLEGSMQCQGLAKVGAEHGRAEKLRMGLVDVQKVADAVHEKVRMGMVDMQKAADSITAAARPTHIRRGSAPPRCQAFSTSTRDQPTGALPTGVESTGAAPTDDGVSLEVTAPPVVPPSWKGWPSMQMRRLFPVQAPALKNDDSNTKDAGNDDEQGTPKQPKAPPENKEEATRMWSGRGWLRWTQSKESRPNPANHRGSRLAHSGFAESMPIWAGQEEPIDGLADIPL